MTYEASEIRVGLETAGISDMYTSVGGSLHSMAKVHWCSNLYLLYNHGLSRVCKARAVSPATTPPILRPLPPPYTLLRKPRPSILNTYIPRYLLVQIKC